MYSQPAPCQMPMASQGEQQPGPDRHAAAQRRAEPGAAPFAEPHHGFADNDGLEDVFPQPGAQRDVPAAPEIADAAGKEGLAEVFGQRHAEALGGAQHHVHAAGKLGVELQGVEQGTHQHGGAGVFGPVVKDGLDVHVGPVGDDEFFHHAPQDALHAEGEGAVVRPGRVEHGGGDAVPAVKGALHHMGPEAQVEQHLPVVGSGPGWCRGAHRRGSSAPSA